MEPISAEEALKQLARINVELDKRARKYSQIERYFGENRPLPAAIVRAGVTKAYQMLMSMAPSNYAGLIVKAATSRMELGGIRSGDARVDDAVWGVWQDNHMDAESKRGLREILTHGRVHAIVWDEIIGEPTITLEDAATVCVEYEPGSRYNPVGAVRRWVEDRYPYANLYRPEGIYKFVGPKDSSGFGGTRWDPRDVPDEEWPLPNDHGVVPVAEIATNRPLTPGSFSKAKGDVEDHLSLIDRIDVLNFCRLVMMFSQGFPVRVVIGDKIVKDDDNKPVAPFELAADLIAQLEDPGAKLAEFKEANVKAFGEASDRDLDELAACSQTPSYYLRSMPIQNIAADTVRALDAPVNFRVEDHKPQVVEGFEWTLRISGKMLANPVALSERAELFWVNRELRSLSERADAASKLKDVMPWQAVVELCFDATQEQIGRWQAQRIADDFAVAAAGELEGE